MGNCSAARQKLKVLEFHLCVCVCVWYAVIFYLLVMMTEFRNTVDISGKLRHYSQITDYQNFYFFLLYIYS